MRLAAVGYCLLLSSTGNNAFAPACRSRRWEGATSATELHGIGDFFKNRLGGPAEDGEDSPSIQAAENKPPVEKAVSKPRPAKRKTEEATICIVGGGVAGLTAAITAAEASSDDTKILLVEASPTFGGRVQSDVTEDGFILDRGFAVFIEEYPFAKKLLDYDKLMLGKFLPGAMVKLPNREALAKVADPLRQPQELLTAIAAPVGSLVDKIKVLPLLQSVFSKSVDEIFAEEETTTLAALQNRWGFSPDMIDTFYKPFLEGIYLAKLDQQSSRMFHFVFKMFSEGAATLPTGGMGAVSQQLVDKAQAAGVELKNNYPVGSLKINDDGSYSIDSTDGTSRINAQKVVIATESKVAESLLAQVEPLLENVEEQAQRSVGCLYYSFDGEAPVSEPILILSGLGAARGSPEFPINNVCFPSVVNPSYAPSGTSLCSVTVLKMAMAAYRGREADLDAAVRQQLAGWFPAVGGAVRDWKLERAYSIPDAQPSQWGGPSPASANRGRPCGSFRGTPLPQGLYVCGDHMATATLNGALESGVNAGEAVANAATGRAVAAVADAIATAAA